MRHLIDPLDFTKDETEELLVLAEDIRNNPEKYQEKCKHKKTNFRQRTPKELLSAYLQTHAVWKLPPDPDRSPQKTSHR